jgi:hypothetical protein
MKRPVANECKWSADRFEPANLVAFRTQHPDGDNVVLAKDITHTFIRSYGTLKMRFENLSSFLDQLTWNAILTGTIGGICCKLCCQIAQRDSFENDGALKIHIRTAPQG